VARQGAAIEKGAYGQTYEQAVALRDKLLEFDRSLAERSRVFDDQADYYSNTDWLSEQEVEVRMSLDMSEGRVCWGSTVP
jgi:hypothetical protein